MPPPPPEVELCPPPPPPPSRLPHPAIRPPDPQVVIVLVKRTLQDLKLAIAGTIVMSAELQEALDNLVDARVPPRWVKVSWPAPNMGLWFAELVKRHEQLNDWVLHDRPAKYWLTGFFNPQGFLTSVRQV